MERQARSEQGAQGRGNQREPGSGLQFSYRCPTSTSTQKSALPEDPEWVRLLKEFAHLLLPFNVEFELSGPFLVQLDQDEGRVLIEMTSRGPVSCRRP